MVCEGPKPRYSEQMEGGVLYFVFCSPGKAHGKDMVNEVGISQKSQQRAVHYDSGAV